MDMSFTHQQHVDDLDNNGHVSRQEELRLACEASGIVWPGTFLRPGTSLYSSGIDKLKSDRAAWGRLPKAKDVLGLVQRALKAEDRMDYPVKVVGVRFRETDGRLVMKENLANPRAHGLGYGPHTIRQLVQQIGTLDDAPRGFASALVYLSDRERAEILNHRLDIMSESQNKLAVEDRTDITLRTRISHSGENSRIARAALSARYGSVTDHDLAGAIGQVLGESDGGAKLDYKPGDAQSRFELIWPNEIPIATFRVGDAHYAGVSVRNSDTGEGSLVISSFLMRAACANLTLSTGEGTTVSIRHVGNPAALMFRVQRAIRAAVDELEPLIQVLTVSAQVSLGSQWTVGKAMAEIAKKFQLPAGNADNWLAQHKASVYPETVWGVTSAITEAAHRLPTWTDEAEWEKVASTVQAKVAEVVMKGTPEAYALEAALKIN